jgi:hypothetical protein
VHLPYIVVYVITGLLLEVDINAWATGIARAVGKVQWVSLASVDPGGLRARFAIDGE